ncbi:hypothetical protein [Paraburkholderia sp. RL18-085-BIA-A]
MTDGSPALPPDLEIVGREPDGFTRTQADFPFGDRDDAAPSVSKRLEHPDLVGVWRQPELRVERLSRNRTGDLATMPGQAKRNFMSVHRDIGHQLNHVPDFYLLNSAANC